MQGLEGMLERITAAAEKATGKTIDQLKAEAVTISIEEEYEEEMRQRAAEARQRKLDNAISVKHRKASVDDLHPKLRGWSWEHGVYLWGPVGSGKTHAAAAMVMEVAPTIGYSVEWWQAQDLMDAIRDAQFERGPMPDLVTPKLLIIDDIGADEEPTPFVKNQFLKIIDRAYRGGTQKLLLTSNHHPEKLAKVLGQRVADRIQEECVVLELSDKHWRKDLAPKLG